MIGCIAAMPSELKAITDRMSEKHEDHIGKMVFVRGKLEGLDTVAVLSGVGKVAAAIAATLLCYKYDLKALIHIGVAGGLKQDQNVMDLVISDEIIQADFDTSPIDGDDGVGKMYYTNSKLSQAAIKAADQMHLPWCIGAVTTQDVFMSRKEDYEKLLANFPDAACAEMEGGATAQVAFDFDVPFIVFRTLSDVVHHDGNQMEFTEFEKKSSDLAGKFLACYFRELRDHYNLEDLKAD
ncbi:5'-methylthioadenosine/adenosylhomocysteine nucleosidase [Ileibacterium valens]|uniref:adenosylhomocysteine nucleosidase n=1 Tax=Ileibacterium valens TaxID=1862668 RepID=A0A1U7NH84_9FIRM|nr:5'-methylthioadenosine/adenosylhomocysteine nucleosidase [Ileibacterium valens]OLU38558.1 hypothetical protein BO224_08830 [Erysipelotrichaceae bacterium NYU-BL-E8]OLU39878.1 hypothetical protein BM735_06560 [Erysipelotrichaceae bacterium NYU-BL-F16]OLU40940.1 hypothetical protein BO222_04085 [Ileibacterium valens]